MTFIWGLCHNRYPSHQSLKLALKYAFMYLKYHSNIPGDNELPYIALQWRHNERDSVSNHRRLDCLLNRLFMPDQRKHQSSASLAFMRGIHRWAANSPHKRPVTRKMLPFDDVIMAQILLRWSRPVSVLALMWSSWYSRCSLTCWLPAWSWWKPLSSSRVSLWVS